MRRQTRQAARPLAQGTLAEAKIFVVTSPEKITPKAKFAWLLVMASNMLVFSSSFLEDNLRNNAEKFCGGGEWQRFHKYLESGYLEAGFVCFDDRGKVFTLAAMSHGLQTIPAEAILAQSKAGA